MDGTMFTLEGDVLSVTLPEGYTQQELVLIAMEEVHLMEKSFYGLELKINGRVTTALALYLGHRLAHICKSVSIFDPKENAFVKSVWH